MDSASFVGGFVFCAVLTGATVLVFVRSLKDGGDTEDHEPPSLP